jgi:hypothetical protein
MSEALKIATASELIAGLKGKTRYATATLPGCGLTVRYQSMTALRQGYYRAATVNKNGDTDQTRVADSDARLLAETLVDEAGNRLFTDREAFEVCQFDGADVAWLARKVRKHCGLVDEGDAGPDPTAVSPATTPGG